MDTHSMPPLLKPFRANAQAQAEFPPTSIKAFSNPLRAIARLGFVVALTFIHVIVMSLAFVRIRDEDKRQARVLKQMRGWAKWIARGMGMKVRVVGDLPSGHAFFAPNHLTWADAVVLGSLVPCYFVPKAEMATWPLVGQVLKITRQIPLERTRSRQLATVNRMLKDHLENGRSVCVFLEGTCSGGDRVLPFMSSLLDAPRGTSVPIVPVALKWMPRKRKLSVSEDLAYWRDSHIFFPHLFRMLGLRGFTVEIQFGDPVDPGSMPNRRLLADDVRDRVISMLGFPEPAEVAASVAV